MPLSPSPSAAHARAAGYVLPAESERLQNKIAGPWHKGHDAAKNVLLCAAAGRYRFAARRNQ
jgi:hypothetical protein